MSATQHAATFQQSEALRLDYLKRLAALETDAANRMIGAYQHALDQIDQQLAGVYKRIERAQANGSDAFSALLQATNLDEQRAYIIGEMQRFATTATTTLNSTTSTAVAMGAAHSMDLLEGIGVEIFHPNAATISQLAARTSTGTVLNQYLAQMGEQAAQQVASNLLSGAINGEQPTRTARRIRSALGQNTQNLNTLVRTETLGAARAGQNASYRANQDVVKGWIWSASGGPRCCAVCWSMNGSEHPLTEEQNSHPNCRCSSYPWLKSYNEILGRTDLPDDGPQPFNGDGLFRRQPDDLQLRVLGQSKFDAYKSGKLPSLDSLVGRSEHVRWGPGLREKTLGELGLPRSPRGGAKGVAERKAAREARLSAAKAARAERGRIIRVGMGDIPIPADELRKGSCELFIRADGTLTPERQALHDRIVEDLLAGKKPVEHPTFHMFGGGPASGKGSIELPNESSMVKIDADEIKRMLPNVANRIDESAASWAAHGHAESSYLAKRATAAAMERHMDTILDGTGNGTLDGVIKKIEQARSHGYRVTGNYVTIDTRTAVERAIVRGKKTGRIVPLSVICGTHRAVSEIVPDVAHLFDEFLLRDTSRGRHALITVASGGSGKLTIGDEIAWRRFLAKATEAPISPKKIKWVS